MNYIKIKTDFWIFLAKVIAKLPLFVILGLGRFIGYLTWIIPNKRKKIAHTNIALCFPELTVHQQKKLVKRNLVSTGLGFAEMIVSFWSKNDKFIHKFEFEGLDKIEKALADKNGCILLSCHMHGIELATRAINIQLKIPVFVLGRQHNNKVFEGYIDRARKRHCEKTIDKKDIRTVMKSLKKNRSIFYIPDQNFSYQCKYIDFFNQPAATVIAPVRIAQSSQAKVVSWFCFREKNCWKVQFHEPLDYFQTDDINTSLKKMNGLFEKQIRRHPEQYLWVHRRFKNHPLGKNHPYKHI